MTTEEEMKRFAAETEQRLLEVAESARAKLSEAGDKLDARLADFDTRATKEVGRWDGRQWGMAVVGLALTIGLAFIAGRASADEPTDIGVPDVECTLIDSATGGDITDKTQVITCVADPSGMCAQEIAGSVELSGKSACAEESGAPLRKMSNDG